MNNLILADYPWSMLFWAAAGGLAFPLICLASTWLLGKLSPTPPPLRASQIKSNPSPSDVDRLEAIEGIGPKIAEFLNAADIRSFAKLAANTPSQLRTILDRDERFGLAQPSTWPLQARLLAERRFEEFLKLAVALNAGVPRLEDIDDIGEARADLLRHNREYPIESVETLAEADEATIKKIFAGTDGEAVAQRYAGRWIAQARRLNEGEEADLLALAGLSRLSLLPIASPNSEPLARDDAAKTDRIPSDRPLMSRDPFVGRLCAPIAALATLTILILSRVVPEPPCPTCTCTACPCPVLESPKFECTLTRTLPVEELFASGDHKLRDRDTNLTKKGKDKLLDLVEELKQEDRIPGALVVVGHADRMHDRRPGGNMTLSRRRADTVASFLKEKLKWDNKIVFDYGKGSAERNPKEDTSGCDPKIPGYVDCLEPDRRVDVHAFYLDSTQ